MKFYFERNAHELDVVVGWHSWDLSDVVLPKFAMEAADDVEENDWRSPLLHVDLDAEARDEEELSKQLEAFVEQLNAWCFEGFGGEVVSPEEGWEKRELVTTSWGNQLNELMDAAMASNKFVESIPMFTQFMREHRDEHRREHPKLRLNLNT